MPRLASQPGDGDCDATRAGQHRSAGLHRDQQPAGDGAEQDGDEGAHLDQAVAADEFVVLQVLRQDRVLDRAEQRRVHAQQRQRDEQQREVALPEAGETDRHDRDLEAA